MTNPFCQLGTAFAGLVFIAIAALEGKEIAQSVGLVEEDEPVLVFEIRHPQNLASVRNAIADDRVVEEREAGFSTQGGRVYVQDLGQAGDFIETAGWVDQPVQIVGLGMDTMEKGESSGAASPMTREERLAKLQSLVHKPALSRGEQLFVLKAMNDGIEI